MYQHLIMWMTDEKADCWECYEEEDRANSRYEELVGDPGVIAAGMYRLTKEHLVMHERKK